MPALEHKNTLVFLNNFILHTTQFLNKFSNVCEEVSNSDGLQKTYLYMHCVSKQFQVHSLPYGGTSHLCAGWNGGGEQHFPPVY